MDHPDSQLKWIDVEAPDRAGAEGEAIDPAESDSREVIELFGAPPEKLGTYLVWAAIGCFVGSAITALLIGFVLRSTPGEHLLLWIAGSAVGLVAGAVWGPRFGCRKIEIRGDRLLLSGPDCRAELLASDVEALVCEKRISLDGGELYVWKIIRLITAAERHVFHVVRGDVLDAMRCFHILSSICHKAVTIDPAAVVALPAKEPGVSLRQWADDARHRAMRALDQMAVRHLVLSAGLLLLAMGLAVAAAAEGEGKPGEGIAAKAGVISIVAFVLSVILAANVLRVAFSRCRTVAALNRMEWQEQWRDQDPLPRIQVGAPAAGATAHASMTARILAVLAVPLFWVPVLGLLLAGPAWLGLRKTSSKLRPLAKVMAMLALVITLLIVGSTMLAMCTR